MLLLFIHTTWISAIPSSSHGRHNLVPFIWRGHANIVPVVSSINLLFCPATVYFPSVVSKANYLSLLFTAYYQPVYLSRLWHLPCQKCQDHNLIFFKQVHYCFLPHNSFMSVSIPFLPLFNIPYYFLPTRKHHNNYVPGRLKSLHVMLMKTFWYSILCIRMFSALKNIKEKLFGAGIIYTISCSSQWDPVRPMNSWKKPLRLLNYWTWNISLTILQMKAYSQGQCIFRYPFLNGKIPQSELIRHKSFNSDL